MSANCSASQARARNGAGERGALAAVVPAAERADEHRAPQLRAALEAKLRVRHQAHPTRPPEAWPRTPTVAAQSVAASVTWISTSHQGSRSGTGSRRRPSARPARTSSAMPPRRCRGSPARPARRAARRTRSRRRPSRGRAARSPARTSRLRGTRRCCPECGPAAVASVAGDDERAARERRRRSASRAIAARHRLAAHVPRLERDDHAER